MKLLIKMKEMFLNFFSLREEDQIYTLIFFAFPIAVGTVTAAFISMQSPMDNLVVDNDWIGFYGNMFGSLLGVLVVIFTFKLKDEKNNEKEMKKRELYLYQYFGVYLTKVEIQMGMLKATLKDKIHGGSYNPSYGIYNAIPNLDFVDKLSELVLEECIPKNTIYQDMILQRHIEEFHIVLNETEKIYFEYKNSSNRKSDLQINNLLIGRYKRLLNKIEKMESMINEIHEAVNNKYKVDLPD